MKLKLIYLLLLLTSACTFQVDVIETPTPQMEEPTLVSTATPTQVISLDLSATPPPSPTFVATNTPITPPQPVLSGNGTIPIVFPPNGTSQIMVGNISAGSSQTYSLNAFQGQVMAISILPESVDSQNTFMLEIKGKDGTILCPIKDYACLFWRGVLPSTQEYFIKVTPEVNGTFKMRVAINPPGQANQYFNYDDPQGRYSLSYSDEFAPMLYGGEVTKLTPEFALQYIDTKQYIPTNLGDAYLLIGSSADSQVVATCTEPASIGAPEEPAGNVMINGVSFVKSKAVGVGAGNIYEQTFFRTVHNGTCYEISYFVHYGNIGNYTPGLVIEFDHSTLLQKFDQTLSTLMFK